MSTANGHSTGAQAAVTGARPVVLLRYRPDVTGRTGRIVHLVPLPPRGETGTTGVAMCGALLCRDLVETVAPGDGMPCLLCAVNHASSAPAPATTSPTDATTVGSGPRGAAVAYRAWGWPVTLRGEQVWLNLEPDTVALIIPLPLAERVTTILNQRRCPPLALAHPDAPEHWVLLAGQRHAVALPWPRSVHWTTGALPLPPTMTPRGPITWTYPPEADALQHCREFEVFAALRTTMRDPPA
ncbi:MAG TPA: hypothetical protein VN327_07315 [Pseudonocardiaceae bacterium]|nr:hypothetical protein [Pseudonocardiaceae bacterium]